MSGRPSISPVPRNRLLPWLFWLGMLAVLTAAFLPFRGQLDKLGRTLTRKREGEGEGPVLKFRHLPPEFRRVPLFP